jgi:ferrous iron transport protein A
VNLREIKKKKQVSEVTVIEFVGPELVIERLHEIGFHKGCVLKILGSAPFGGPMLVELNSTVLALRDEESECLMIRL